MTAGELVPVEDTTRALMEIGAYARIEHGRQARRVPYVATLATEALGTAGWGLGEFAGWAAGDDARTAVVAGAWCLAVLAAIIGWLMARRVPRAWRARVRVAVVGGCGWIGLAVTTTPVAWWASGLLVAGAALTWSKWLAAHQVPRAGDLPTFLVEEMPDDLAARVSARWATRVGAPGGAAPTTRLTLREDLPQATRWRVESEPGTITFAELFARRERIAAALNLPVTKLIFEPWDEDEGQAELTVVTRDLLAGGVDYEGPIYRDGMIYVGKYADGTGGAWYAAYDEVGCRCGLATGDPGAGKSTLLTSVGIALRWSGEWHVIFGDGDPEGGSAPLLNRVAHWAAAGAQAALGQLEAIEALIEVRAMLKATLTAGPDGRAVPITDAARQLPLAKIVPSPELPGVMWILDELQRLVTDPWLKKRGFVERLEKIVRIGRKYAVVVLAGTQSLLAADFGLSTALRGWLAARNLFALRNSNKSEKAVVSGLEISPASLPKGGGYAYAAGSGRVSILRVAYASDVAMSQYSQGMPTSPIDRDSAAAIAPFLPDESNDPVEELARKVAQLDAWRARIVTTAQAPAAKWAGVEGIDGIDIPEPVLATVTSITTRRPAELPEEVGPDVDVLKPAHQAVYRVMQRGCYRTGEIAAETGMLAPAVSKALKALVELDLVHKVGHGEYALGPDTEQSAVG